MSLPDSQFIGTNGFDNLRAKIGWAYQHIKRFDSLYVEFCRQKAYTLTEQDDPVNGRHVRRCEFNPIPADIMLGLSDFAYSLRSGLDQLAWQLALLGNPEPSRDVMFPIYHDRTSNTEDRFRKAVWDMPCEAVAIIKDLQPYNRGAGFRDDPLWQLNELSNIDKHRVPVGRGVLTDLYLEPAGWIRRDLDYGVEISWPIACKNSVVFKPNIPTLVFGDPLGSPKSVPVELGREEIAGIYGSEQEFVRALDLRGTKG